MTSCLFRCLPLALLAVTPLFAQTGSGCPAPPTILTSAQPNIFSDQQEQWLGDATSDMLERRFRTIQDPAQNAYLDRIVARLLTGLPHTDIQFHVLLLDSSEVNAFSLAGGRVYITRKLVANAKSEDEIAGVLAHEMGHILTHQFAYETTADFKRLLNVTALGDKADVYAKFQRLAEARLTDKHRSAGGDTDDKQNQADTIAVYAVARAGYRPQAFSEFWDRMFFVGGKTGGPISDFFGTTSPESKRLRAILKLVTALPPACGGTQPSASPEFLAWQTLVLSHQNSTPTPQVKAAAEVSLTPALRMDLDRLRFSPDGKYALAQDESSITVLTREPWHSLFRIDAEDAQPADFSPDSQRVVFHTIGLHTEEWSIANQKPIASHDPITRDECLETRLSPDGRSLFCISVRYDGDVYVFDLSMLDAAAGNVLFQKKGFFEPTDAFLYQFALLRMEGGLQDLIPASFSADGNSLIIGPSADKLAFDLRTRTPIPIGGDIKTFINGPYVFIGSDKLLGINVQTAKAAVFTFPAGKLVQNVPFALANLAPVTSGNFVLSRNVSGYAVGLADVTAAKFVAASQTPSMDVYNNWLLNENTDGSVLLHKMGDKATPDTQAILPLSPLGRIHAVASADRHFLAVTTHTRAAVWDLRTGTQVFLSRRFNSAVFAPDDSLYVEMPKLDKQPRAIHHITLFPEATGAPLPYKLEDTTRLTYGMLQEWKKPYAKKGVDLVVHNVRDNAVLWTRHFEAGEPAHTPNLIVGQTILGFSLKSDFAKSRIAAVPALATQAAAVKNRDRGVLLQLISNLDGTILREVIVDPPARPDGIDGVNFAGASVYVTSSDNRTVVYSAETGSQLRQFFGTVTAIDPITRRICVRNRPDEALVLDPENQLPGQELAAFRTGSPIRFSTFDGRGRLILLTADQKVRTFDLSSPPSPHPAETATR